MDKEKKLQGKGTKICFGSKINTSESGGLTGYAAIYDVIDGDGDIIRQGTFKRALNNQIASGHVALMIRHIANGGDVLESVGTITGGKETDEGFLIDAQFDSDADAQKVRTKLKDNAKRYGLSVGWDWRGTLYTEMETGGKEFTEMNLKEITITMFPSQEGTIGTLEGKEALKAQIDRINARMDALESKLAGTEADRDAAQDAGKKSSIRAALTSELARQQLVLMKLKENRK